MATKIRLARHGRKGRPFYHVVVADSRAPRDGRYIERIGSYNPMTNPATIDLNFDRALYWLMTGAYKARLEAEAKVKEAKAEIVAKKQAEIAAAKAEAEAAARAEVEAAATEVAAVEAPEAQAETPAAE